MSTTDPPQSTEHSAGSVPPLILKPPTSVTASWVTDANIARLSHDILKQLQNDQPSPQTTETSHPPTHYETQTLRPVLPASTNQRIRFNIIRHRYAMSEKKTVQLFKSFTTTLCDIDQHIIVLPVNLQNNIYRDSPNKNRCKQ
jgi:hypothetical protein